MSINMLINELDIKTIASIIKTATINFKIKRIMLPLMGPNFLGELLLFLRRVGIYPSFGWGYLIPKEYVSQASLN